MSAVDPTRYTTFEVVNVDGKTNPNTAAVFADVGNAAWLMLLYPGKGTHAVDNPDYCITNAVVATLVELSPGDCVVAVVPFANAPEVRSLALTVTLPDSA